MSVYEKGQLVWAKVKGYAWWPAVVGKTNVAKNNEVEKEIEVSFVGEDTYATLAQDKIANFEEKFNEFSKVKTKKLQEAIKIAQQMLKKSINIQSERNEEVKQDKRASSTSKSRKEDMNSKAETAVKVRGRPRKVDEEKPKSKISASTRKEMSRDREKSKDRIVRTSKADDYAGTVEIQREKQPKDKTKEFDVPKKQEFAHQRLTRSHSKKALEAISTVPTLPSARKEKKATTSKQAVVDLTIQSKPEPQPEKVLEALDEFKQPVARPRHLNTEKPIERNLLNSINAEPSSHSRIEVTTKKISNKTILNTAVPKVGEKRPASFWFKDQPGPTYLSHVKGKELRNSATEFIVKKVRVSPTFQQKMSSIKATKLKDIQKPRNSAAKALIAYNSLMIRKFENDLEQLLKHLVIRFKSKEKMGEDDPDQVKLLNIVTEFQKSKFNGSEFISSEIGKLFKTIHRLLIGHRHLLNNVGNILIVTLAKVLHQIKERIIRFCLDNTEYAEAFDIDEEVDTSSLGIGNVDMAEIKAKLEEQKASAILRDQNILIEGQRPATLLVRKDSVKKEEDALRENRSLQGKKALVNLIPPPESPKLKLEEEKNKTEDSPISIEDGSSYTGTTFLLRRKICAKLTKALQETYSAEKEKAQDVALVVEGLVNKCYSEAISEYKQAIKTVYHIIKGQIFSMEDILDFRNLELSSFKEIIKGHTKDPIDNASKESCDKNSKDLSTVKDQFKQNNSMNSIQEVKNDGPDVIEKQEFLSSRPSETDVKERIREPFAVISENVNQVRGSQH